MKTTQIKSTTTFSSRFNVVEKDIYELFYLLYGDRPGFNQAYLDLLDLLERSFNQRSEWLMTRDQARLKGEDWLLSSNWVGMALYVDRFANDLQGVIDKLDYLKELGVNLIHLMPIMKSPEGENDGGYAVSDYCKVDGKFGSNGDLEQLIDQLRKRDMGIIMDLVINHTADDHPWAIEARSGDLSAQELYLMYELGVVPQKFEETLSEIFPETSPGNFILEPATKKYVFSTFNRFQWDLNYKNPLVFIKMLENLLWLFNLGVDIVRLDAPAFIWKELGTNCQNLPAVHLILQLFKLSTKVVAPGTALLSEAIVAPREILKYFGGNQAECDIAYNALFMALLWDTVCTQNNKLLKVSLERLPSKPQGTTWLNYVRCHDDIGLGFEDESIIGAGYTPFEHRQFILNYLTGKFPGSLAKGALYMYNPKTKDARLSGSLASLIGLEKAIEDQDLESRKVAIQKILLLHSIILSFGGIPMLYYGDELGYLNDYSYLADSERKMDNRWMHRPKIDWKKAEKRHIPGTIEYSVFQQLKKLISVRKKTPEFADHNSMTILDLNDAQILAYLRFGVTSNTLVLCNLSDQPKQFHLQDLNFLSPYFPMGFVNKLKGDVPVQAQSSIQLDAYGFLWLGKQSVN